MSDSRRVLGIDPGLAVTGFGVILGDGVQASALAMGAIRTKAKLPRAQRLERIHTRVVELIEQHAVTELAVETQFVAENVRSAMALGEGLLQMSLRGALYAAGLCRVITCLLQGFSH